MVHLTMWLPESWKPIFVTSMEPTTPHRCTPLTSVPASNSILNSCNSTHMGWPALCWVLGVLPQRVMAPCSQRGVWQSICHHTQCKCANAVMSACSQSPAGAYHDCRDQRSCSKMMKGLLRLGWAVGQAKVERGDGEHRKCSR